MEHIHPHDREGSEELGQKNIIELADGKLTEDLSGEIPVYRFVPTNGSPFKGPGVKAVYDAIKNGTSKDESYHQILSNIQRQKTILETTEVVLRGSSEIVAPIISESLLYSLTNPTVQEIADSAKNFQIAMKGSKFWIADTVEPMTDRPPDSSDFPYFTDE